MVACSGKGRGRNEPAEFLKYLTNKNYSALNMIDSSFVVVDPLLADYYGLPFPAKGDGSFQRVALPKNSVRGGLMGQGAVQTITLRQELKKSTNSTCFAVDITSPNCP